MVLCSQVESIAGAEFWKLEIIIYSGLRIYTQQFLYQDISYNFFDQFPIYIKQLPNPPIQNMKPNLVFIGNEIPLFEKLFPLIGNQGANHDWF